MRTPDPPLDPVGTTWLGDADAADLSVNGRQFLTSIYPMTETSVVEIATNLLDARHRIGDGLGAARDLIVALDRAISISVVVLAIVPCRVGPHEIAVRDRLFRRASRYVDDHVAYLLESSIRYRHRQFAEFEQRVLGAVQLEGAIDRYAQARQRAKAIAPSGGA